MEKRYIENVCLKSPGLAIKAGGNAVVKYASTFAIKANGVISVDTTTADAPGLEDSLGRLGVATSDIADDFQRIYTLLGAVNKTTGVITFTWVHGDDFAIGRAPKTEDINYGNSGSDDFLKVVIGHVWIKNETGAVFIPGTTVLDVGNSTVQYIDAYGYVGK